MTTHEHVTPELLRDAADLVVRTQFGCPRMLKIALHVHVALANNLLDELTDRGILGPARGARAREVLYPPEEHNDALARVAEQPSVRSR